MQAINGIQFATINTNAGFNGGMVVDAASAHRTAYLHDERPASKRPYSGGLRSQSKRDGAPGMQMPVQDAVTQDCQNDLLSTRTTTWRLDNRQLPEVAWAMLVLNRSLCG